MKLETHSAIIESKKYWSRRNVRYCGTVCSIETGKKLESSRPGMRIIDEGKRSCSLIDSSFPSDYRIVKKAEKNYNPLKFEMVRISHMRTLKFAPVIISELDRVGHVTDKSLQETGIECPVGFLQRVC